MPNVNEITPDPKTLFGGDKGDYSRRAGSGIGGMFGQSPGMMSVGDRWQRKAGEGEDPTFLKPQDWFNGKIEGEMTGDTSRDSRYMLAKYGLFGAPWMPAMFVESQKKGDKIKENIAMDAKRQQQQANFNKYGSPYQRNVPYTENQPFSGGYYNDLASRLFQNSQMGGLL